MSKFAVCMSQVYVSPLPLRRGGASAVHGKCEGREDGTALRLSLSPLSLDLESSLSVLEVAVRCDPHRDPR